MKHLKFFYLLLILTLVGCNDIKQDNSIVEKERCFEYYDNYEQKINEKWTYKSDLEIGTKAFFDGTYYSSKIDSCIYAFNTIEYSRDLNTQDIYQNHNYYIIDIFSDEELYYGNEQSEYQTVLSEYKTTED